VKGDASPPDRIDDVVAAWRAELPEVATVDLALSKRVVRLAAMLQEVANTELGDLGLTPAEYEVLAVLRSAGTPYRLRPTHLIGRLLLSSGGTSNLLRRMTESGLVEREADQRDGRGSWVRLTDRGVRTAETAVRAATGAQAALLRAVPEPARQALADQLRDALVGLGDHSRSPDRPSGH
jgi:DNA-binding MarR family transcriptional regulator